MIALWADLLRHGQLEPAAGNAAAPIVTATTSATAITGNSHAGGLGATDPNANFTC